MKSYAKYLKTPSRMLRTNMTDAEEQLWFHLRRKQIQGKQFYRQKPLFNYIVDFYCPAANLVIELDGSQHYESMNLEQDKVRDQFLSGFGFTVLRFDNRQVLTELNAVLAVIEERVRLATSNPP